MRLGVTVFFVIANRSRSSARVSIVREIRPGWSRFRVRVRAALRAGVMIPVSSARWCGVRAASCCLMIFAPMRSREISFCWGGVATGS